MVRDGNLLNRRFCNKSGKGLRDVRGILPSCGIVNLPQPWGLRRCKGAWTMMSNGTADMRIAERTGACVLLGDVRVLACSVRLTSSLLA